MAIRPDDAANLAKGVREYFADAESLLLQRIAAAMAKGIDAPDWAERKLLATQDLLRHTDRILQDVSKGVPGAVEQAVGIAYNRGTATAGADLAGAGLLAGAFDETPDTGAVAAIVAETVGKLDPMRFQIKRSVADAYQEAVTLTAAQVTTGVLDRQEASRRVLTRLTKNGVTGFTDNSGRKWEMGAYAEMSVRTAAMNASLQGHVDRVADLGVDTMSISDAPEECKICRPWEGRVVSLSGRTTGRLADGVTVKGSLSEARSDGVFHPNCRHSMSIYIPGVSKVQKDTADPEGDRLRKQQRSYERKVRELKRSSAIADGFGGRAAKAARSELRAYQAQFRVWREANGLKDLSYRTSLRARGPLPEAPEAPLPPTLAPVPNLPDEVAALPVEALEAATVSRADMFTLESTADWDDEDFMDLMSQSWDDPELLARIEAIMEAREAKADTTPAVRPAPAEVADAMKSPALDPFTGKPYTDPELNPTARKSRGLTKAQVLDEDYRNYVDASYLRAENEMAGNFLNPAGKAAGMNGYDLFLASVATARKYASEELIAYWEANGRHSKTSFDYMMNQTPSAYKAFERVKRAGFGGNRGEYGRGNR